jgi:hypothetical protein
MRHHVPDINLPPVIVDRGNQSVLVPGDVKHRQATNTIRTPEDSPQLSKCCKVRRCHDLVPSSKRRPRIRIPRPEPDQRWLGDDVHLDALYHNGIVVNQAGCTTCLTGMGGAG